MVVTLLRDNDALKSGWSIALESFDSAKFRWQGDLRWQRLGFVIGSYADVSTDARNISDNPGLIIPLSKNRNPHSKSRSTPAIHAFPNPGSPKSMGSSKTVTTLAGVPRCRSR